MDTSRLTPTNSINNTVVKSQSTIMSLPINDSTNVSEQLLSPTMTKKKSVSSKERLFSVGSLHRTSLNKSNEHLIKVITQPTDVYNLSEHERKSPTKRDEQKLTSLSVTIPENVNYKNYFQKKV